MSDKIMKKNILELVKTYVLFLCVFVLQKPLFMLFYHVYIQNSPPVTGGALSGTGSC